MKEDKLLKDTKYRMDFVKLFLDEIMNKVY